MHIVRIERFLPRPVKLKLAFVRVAGAAMRDSQGIPRKSRESIFQQVSLGEQQSERIDVALFVE